MTATDADPGAGPAGSDVRIEKDALGPVRVPADHYWGAQTQRSVENFRIGVGRFTWGRPVIRALGILKLCAAQANLELGELPADRAALIEAAAREVIDGRLDDEFPLVVFQTGSGTQTNMNANEVIAGRANELAGAGRGGKTPIHPNDDVNRSQSSNDAFPTVMHVATVEEIEGAVIPAVEALRDTLRAKSAAYADVVMLGRTHLQDATPVTLGQVIGGWAAQLDGALDAIRAALPPLYQLALGGTAVGTGLNADPRFGGPRDREDRGGDRPPVRGAPDKFAALSAHDAMVGASAALRTLAVAAMKIANDVRWYACGPRAGSASCSSRRTSRARRSCPARSTRPRARRSPGRGPGVRLRRRRRDRRVAGQLPAERVQAGDPRQRPDLGHAARRGDRSFDRNCAAGIEPNLPRIREHLEDSLMLVTALNPHIGYEKSAEIALHAHQTARRSGRPRSSSAT